MLSKVSSLSCVSTDYTTLPRVIIIDMKLHIYAVRHGQTYFNRYNRLQGWSNAPLTAQGITDADEVGKRLSQINFRAAYSSDTDRAQVTAQRILKLNIASQPRPELKAIMNFREQFYGYFEGQDMGSAWLAAGGPHGAPTYTQIVKQFGLAATRDFLKEADPFHDAESDTEYWRRVEQGFQVIASDPQLLDNDRVLIVWHGNSLLSLVHRFGGSAYEHSERPKNGSVTCFDFDSNLSFEESIRIVSYGQ